MRRFACVLVVVVALVSAIEGAATQSSGRASSTRPVVRDSTYLADVASLIASGQYDSVRQLASEATPRALASGDTVLAARLALARGWVGLQSGDVADARNSYRDAVEWARDAQDTVTWMDGLRFGAYASGAMGYGGEAEDQCRRLLDLARACRDADREAWAHVGIGYRQLLAGNGPFARYRYSQAIMLFRKAGDRDGELTPLVGLGRLYTVSGEIDSARACFQRAWLEATELGHDREAAHALNNLGTIEHEYGDLALAIDYYRRAFDLQQSSGNLNEAVTPASNLALAWTAIGRHHEAVEALRQTLEICNRAGLRAHAGLVLKDLGYALSSADRPNAAAAVFRRALAMGDTIDADVRVDAARGLAYALAMADSVDTAVDVLRQALVDTRGCKLGDVVLARALLARFLGYRGDRADALVAARRAQALSAGLPPGPLRATALFTASACYHAVGNADSALALLAAGETAMDVPESVGPGGGGEPSIAAFAPAAECLLDFPTDRSVEERRAALFDAFERNRNADELASITDPRRETDIHHGRARVTTARELQQRMLQRGDLLLEFFTTSRRSYLFAVSPDSIAYAPLPGFLSPLARQVADFCREIASPPGPDAMAPAALVPLQAALGEQLLGPVAAMLSRASRVIVVPDGFLHSLPFELLALPDSTGTPVALIDRLTVFRAPSASAFAASEWSRPDDGAGAFLVVSGGEEGRGSLAGARSEADAIEARYADVVEYRGPLSARELCDHMQAARLIHLAGHVEINDEMPWYSGILVGAADEADTPSGVRSASLTHFEILSVEDSVRFARMFPHDPFLRAHQIAALSLPARLAVLSGCESALGQETFGAGVIGLGSAFNRAGVATVVGSLWRVDDRATGRLMRGFYGGLADGLSTAGALRRAQLALRADPHTAHPFYWAGFVVVGNGGEPVALRRKSGVPAETTVLAGILIVLLVVAAWILPRRAGREKLRTPV